MLNPVLITSPEVLKAYLPILEGARFVVADVETFRTEPSNGKLLGVALSSPSMSNEGVYVALQWYDFKTSTWHANLELTEMRSLLANFLRNVRLIGHNYAYDKKWIDSFFGIDSTWHADTRLMWHMASAPLGPRGYGLKDAQVEILGWDAKGDVALAEQVEARGGFLKTGGHYLADLNTLGHYAALDAVSTAQLYTTFSEFFNRFDCWNLLGKMVRYSWLLEECTQAGIRVDKGALEGVITVLEDTHAAYEGLFFELAHDKIAALETIWREHRAAKYVQPAAKQNFLNNWSIQKKFNLSSDKDKRELLYDIYELPVVAQTDAGKPSTAQDVIAGIANLRPDLKEIIDAYLEANSTEALLNIFAKPWLGALDGGRLRPRFNPCGTVSYRLSGFKPYLLNAPFSELELMSCLTCDEGWEGVHADFVSVEPAVTAHYSQDPSLLKVFKTGLGDVYLDLALTLFPADTGLRQGYDPGLPVTSAIKKKFEKQRKIAKIIQLAVQYTGTEYTVAKNLSNSGIPTTRSEARELVQAYWKHFRKVKAMNDALFSLNRKKGYLRNVIGRVIRVPYPDYKDLPNRFIQSSAHDLLSMWVLNIDSLVRERQVEAKPMIIDIHDATTWQVKKDQKGALVQIFKDALTQLNETYKLTVEIKAEIKTFHTLAGLKGDD